MTVMRRIRRLLAWTVFIALALALVVAVSLRLLLGASLARTGGHARLAGLGEPVEIQRDAQGIPTIRAASLADAVRAQGFVHAQERCFQMDMGRRYAAGELAEVVGPRMLDTDRRMRALRFRDVAHRTYAGLPAAQRELIDAYTDGVNAGLADLGARPPEYFALGAPPRAWLPEDCVLTLLMMFDGLSVDKESELRTAVMREALPLELAAFLTPESTRFDVPLIGGDPAYAPAPVPGPDVVDLRKRTKTKEGSVAEPKALPMGSNNFAVSGARSAHGGAILANDMHLSIRVPGMWMRMQMEWKGADGAPRRCAGVTLPGSPCIVAGATDDLAWGFTNVTGDFHDYAIVEVDPANPTRRYAFGPGEHEPFGEVVETILVKGAEPVTLTLRTTRWGPVVRDDHKGRPLALVWTALRPEAINFDLFDIMSAATLEEGLDAAARWNGPPQNVLIADKGGRIGWTVSGYLPKRVGFDGRTPANWAAPGPSGDTPRWDGALSAEERPRVVDPANGTLYTANNRTAALSRSALYGSQWALPSRAARIAELLGAQEKLSERDLLAIQLDTRSAVHDFHRDLILEMVGESEPDARLRAARELVEGWSGLADVDQRAFPVLTTFRTRLHRRIFAPLVAPCGDVDARFAYSWFLAEEPARRLLESRPGHLLPPGDPDWRAVVQGALTEALDSLEERFPGKFIDGATTNGGFGVAWGEVNRARVAHPLSSGVRQLSRWLDMPRDPLPGHWSTVRVATPGFGASQRMVVSPGKPDSAILHIPVGQSGHPLSRHYADMQGAWLRGEATPMWAGAGVSSFTLRP